MYVVGISIRICNITGKQFDLELGLLYVPQSILQEQEIQHVVIQQYKLDVDSGLRGFWPQYVREIYHFGSVLYRSYKYARPYAVQKIIENC